MHVVDHERERPTPGERAGELEECPLGVLAGLAVRQPDGGDDAAHRDRRDLQLGGQLARRAGAERLRDRLAQRPQRDALAVLAAAPRQHGVRDRLQLGDEAGLADARLADDRQQLRLAPRHDARERLAQHGDLALAADERLVEAAGDRRRVGVEAAEQEAAVLEPRRAGGMPHHPPRRLGQPDLPGAAAWARRSATATASPITGGSPAAMTSPVQAPERTPRGSASRSSAAARSARCASSSWASGMPSTATAASLRSSTTRPSWWPNTARTVAWKRSTTPRSDSGSRPGSSGWAREDTTHVTRWRAAGACAGARGGRGHVLSQDRRFELPQRGRGLDAEPVDERAARVAVRGERVGLPPFAVQREHELPAQRLAQRVVLHQRLQLAHDLRVAAAGEVGLDALAQAPEAQVLEPGDLRLGECSSATSASAGPRHSVRASRSVAAASRGSPTASSLRPARSPSSKRSASSAAGASRTE